MSLADDLGEQVARYDKDVGVWNNVETYSKVGLFTQDWGGEGEPVVQVCFEWHKQATFSDGTRYIGVRANYGRPEGKELRLHLGDAIRDIRGKAGFERSSNHWPAYQLAPSPDGEYWNDLSDLRVQLLDVLHTAWMSFSEPIDRAVAAWREARVS